MSVTPESGGKVAESKVREAAERTAEHLNVTFKILQHLSTQSVRHPLSNSHSRAGQSVLMTRGDARGPSNDGDPVPFVERV